MRWVGLEPGDLLGGRREVMVAWTGVETVDVSRFERCVR